MMNFLIEHSISIILSCGTILIGYGYYKSKIEDLIEKSKVVDDMVNRVVELEKFQAVQQNTNAHELQQWHDMVEWLKSLEKKLDEALKR